MAQPDNKGADTLAKALGPLLAQIKNEIVNELKPVIVATGQTSELKIDNLQKEIQVLTGVVGGQKKTIARKADAATPNVTATIATDESPIPQPVGNKKPFAANRLVFFNSRFKEDKEFREKYVTPEIRKLMDEDKTCKSKTIPEQKLVAESRFCWNHIKTHHDDIFKEIGLTYEASKKAHEEANVAPQQDAEPHTPEGV